VPAHEDRHLLPTVIDLWPSYLAFLPIYPAVQKFWDDAIKGSG
jgi:hypothetical protein